MRLLESEGKGFAVVAEESAAASEQLSAEATCLKEMVDHFTLASE